MENTNKVSLIKTVLFTVCSILVLDSFIPPAIIGVSSITIWIITSVVFFIPYGLLSAEIGSTYPDDGGIVSWVRRAFGEFWAVLEGWLYWVNVAFWMPSIFATFSEWIALAIWPDMSMLLQGIIAVTMCWLIVYIGVKGKELSINVSAFMAYLKMGILLLFGIMGVIYGIKNGFANDFSLASFVPSIDDTIIYFGVIIYNLLGFELIGSIGSEIDDAQHTVPKMTIIAGLAITFFYAFGTFGVLAAIPAAEVDEVDGFVYALRELCTVFDGASDIVFYVLITGTIITLVANMITWTLGANEAFVAELDKRSPFLSHRNEKYGTLDNLYYVMGGIATVLVILNYSLAGDANEIFWALFSFGTIIFLSCYLIMFVAAIKLKFTDNATEGYRIPGGKIGTLICAILSFAGVALALYLLIDLDTSGYGFWMQFIGTAITILAGVYIYFAGKKREVK